MATFQCFAKSINLSYCQPIYPKFMYMNTINQLKNRNKCLDIGVGVGQLLFPLSPYFKRLKGIDIDENILQVAKKKLYTMEIDLKNQIIIEKKNILNIQTTEKYDLIVIGQTLHELPINETLKITKNILESQGKLLIINYFLNNVQFKTKQCLVTNSFNSNEDSSYNKFRQLIKPYQDFDQQILHREQIKEPKFIFDELFPKVKKQIVQIPVQMCFNSYLYYLKSSSGYKNYIQKCRNNPLTQIQNGCNTQRICKFDFISIQCSTD